MTVIFLTEYNPKKYAVTLQKNKRVKVQKFEDSSDDSNVIYNIHPLEVFVGKSEVCDMTEISGARDRLVFDGKTILLRISEGNNKHKFLYIGVDMLCTFLLIDRIYRYILLTGINLLSCSIAKCEENIYFLTPHFRFVKKDKIDENELLNTNEDFFIPFDYHVSECGIDSFQYIHRYKIHSNYTEYTGDME